MLRSLSLEGASQDLRYATRMLRSNTGFTTTAVLSLALGIGANTAIFSLIDALLLRMLPVRDPQQLMQITLTQVGRRTDSFSYPAIRALQEQADVFSGLCGFSGASYNIGEPGGIQRVSGAWVTGSFYQTLGVEPVIGRVLTPEDDLAGGGAGGPAAVISYGYWERKFGKDLHVLGKPLLIDGKPVTVVGVAARGFTGANVGEVADVTVPLSALPQLSPEGAFRQWDVGARWLRVLGRPKPGVSRAQVRAQLAVLWPQIAKALVRPQMSPEQRQADLTSVVDVVPGGTGWSAFRRQFTRPLLVLMAVVALVLLIACANVANLLLARATARQKEIAVRLAIGAGRARLVRQLLTESLLLASLGGALGVLFAYAGSRILLSMLSSGRTTPIALDVHPDLRVLGFTCAVALITGILFGLAPAFRATSAGPGPALNQNTRGSGGSRGLLAPALVISQVALSLLLLIGSGLFVRSLENLQNLDSGFHHEGVLLVELDPRRNGYKDTRLTSLYEELLDRVGRMPGVRSVSLSLNTPLSGGYWSNNILIQGMPAAAGKDSAHMNGVAPRYFETMGTPLLTGRDFTSRDKAGSPPVAIVNQAFVREYLQANQALGQHLSVAHSPFWQNMEVVGVVRDAVSFTLRDPAPPAVYVPYFQDRRGPAPATIEVLEAGSVAQVTASVRQNIQRRLPDTPLTVHTLTEQVNRSLVQERLVATLASFFGLLALGLAAVGLYGLMAYGVARRTGEIGVRMALGARRSNVLWLILGATLRLVAAGIGLGLPLAWAASRLVSNMLFGLTTTDPLTIAAATAILVATASVAGFLPARRASRVDPIVALRYE